MSTEITCLIHHGKFPSFTEFCVNEANDENTSKKLSQVSNF